MRREKNVCMRVCVCTRALSAVWLTLRILIESHQQQRERQRDIEPHWDTKRERESSGWSCLHQSSNTCCCWFPTKLSAGALLSLLLDVRCLCCWSFTVFTASEVFVDFFFFMWLNSCWSMVFVVQVVGFRLDYFTSELSGVKLQPQGECPLLLFVSAVAALMIYLRSTQLTFEQMIKTEFKQTV